MNKIIVALLALLLVASPVAAQWQTPDHSVPVGRGGGNTGFKAAVPGVAGQPLVSQGAAADPAFSTIGNAGFTPGAANTVKGSLNGTTTADIPLPNCIATNQAIRWTAGVGATCGGVLTLTGYDMPINMGLTASVVGGALTVSMTTAAGAIPTSTDPIFIPFRSTVATSGVVSWGTVSAATSVVVPSGATLGASSSNVPFRVWLFATANGGTPALGVAGCSNATTIFPCASWEHTLKTSITVSTAADNAGVLYVTNGVTLDAVRIIGFCDFASGLVTAGLWDTSCTTVQVFGPGVKKPGENVQTIYSTTSTITTGSGTSQVATTSAGTVTPSASANLIKITVSGVLSTVAGSPTARTYRAPGASGACTTAIGPFAVASSAAANIYFPTTFVTIDAPGTVAQQTYALCISNTSASNSTWCSNAIAVQTCTITIEEIMGSSPEPVNDNVHPGVFSKVG